MLYHLFKSPELIMGATVSVIAAFGLPFIVMSADLSHNPCPSVCAMPIENITPEDQSDDR